MHRSVLTLSRQGQQEIFEILSKIHNNPASWVSNLFNFSGQQLSEVQP
jgi:hypothetical protein